MEINEKGESMWEGKKESAVRGLGKERSRTETMELRVSRGTKQTCETKRQSGRERSR